MSSLNNSARFLKLSGEVALNFGFSPAREFERAVKGAERTAGWRSGAYNFPAVARICTAQQAQKPEAMLAFYATPAPVHMPTHLPPRESAEFGLSVMGSPESLSEVVLIKTLATILREWGTPLLRVRLNALGDRDSFQRFSRELSAYLRKQSAEMDPACRTLANDNPFSLYTCQNQVCREVLEDAPRATNFLSEKSRAHLKSVLEHIESLGLPYELDDKLMSDEREARLLFAFDLPEDSTVLYSHGGRFDDYVRRLTGRKEASAVHGSVFFRKGAATREHFTTAPAHKPKVYFIQLGGRAKLQGLHVVDMLRSAGVAVSQSFDAAHLAPQLVAAKALGVSHVLIMGQREALDGTILIRNSKNSSQTILPVSQLPKFLKTLK